MKIAKVVKLLVAFFAMNDKQMRLKDIQLLLAEIDGRLGKRNIKKSLECELNSEDIAEGYTLVQAEIHYTDMDLRNGGYTKSKGIIWAFIQRKTSA